MIVEKKRLSTTFSFVRARHWVYRVYVSAIVFTLGMHRGITINLAGWRLQNLGLQALRQPRPINASMDRGLRGLNRNEPVMDRGGGAGEIGNLVNLNAGRGEKYSVEEFRNKGY